MIRLRWNGAVRALLLAALVLSPVAALAQSFVNFESGQVRPLALSADGNRLFAVNTPDNRLEIFDVTGGSLAHSESVPVGMEPVAVAVRNASEVWVVNHLSDSVSIVERRLLARPRDPHAPDLRRAAGHRLRGTGRQPRVHHDRAPRPELPRIDRGEPHDRRDAAPIVQVFDATNLGAALGGTPVGNVALFGDTPRALATNGSTVCAAVFHSGNRTTALNEIHVCDGGAGAPACTLRRLSMPGGLPLPNENQQGIDGPEVGLIVKFNPATGDWEDELGRDWSNAVRFDLPDLDVFAINANTLAQTDSWASVGTVLFNMAVNPATGNLYVSNTEALNEVRFEGPGTAVHDRPGPPARVSDHRDRRRDRLAAAPEQAHRLRPAPGARGRQEPLARDATRDGDHRRRRDRLRRRVRLGQGRHLRRRRPRGRQLRAVVVEPHPALRRRARRARAERGATTASTSSRASTTRSR